MLVVCLKRVLKPCLLFCRVSAECQTCNTGVVRQRGCWKKHPLCPAGLSIGQVWPKGECSSGTLEILYSRKFSDRIYLCTISYMASVRNFELLSGRACIATHKYVLVNSNMEGFRFTERHCTCYLKGLGDLKRSVTRKPYLRQG